MLIYRYNGDDPRFYRYTMRKWFLPMVALLIIARVVAEVYFDAVWESVYKIPIVYFLFAVPFVVIICVLSDIQCIYRYQRNLWTGKMVKMSGPFYEKTIELER